MQGFIKTSGWVVTCACLLLAFNIRANTFFVDANGTNPTPPFSDWSTAATNIQDAIDASSAGDVILVTNGIYSTGGRSMDGVLTNAFPSTKQSLCKA